MELIGFRKIFEKNIALFFSVMSLVLVFVYICKNKPLQMDELSTFFHCSDKNFEELNISNSLGVNMIPPVYFTIIWVIGKIASLNEITMRLPSLLFGILSLVVMQNSMKRLFPKECINLCLFALISHCPILIFSICEARPFALYLMLTVFFTHHLLFYRKTKTHFFIVSSLAFLIPGTFYIGGIYTLFLLIFFIIDRIKKNLDFKHCLYACLLGWLIFCIIVLPTFYDHLTNTYTGHFSTGYKVRLSDLFTLYGSQVYLPISLLLLVLCQSWNPSTFVKNKSENLNDAPVSILIFASFLVIPFVFFILCKVFNFGIFQNRYFIPNLIFYFFIFCLVLFRIGKITKSKMWLGLNYFLCTIVLFLIARSFGKSYKAESPADSILSAVKTQKNIVTFSRRIAFHVNHYHGAEVDCYQIVGDEKYASHMKNFSSKLNPIALSQLPLLLDKLLSKNESILFLDGSMVSNGDQYIHTFIDSQKYKVVRYDVPKSPQANLAYLVSKS